MLSLNSSLHWLASYPKSGNTYLRVLLSNYLSDGESPVDINQLPFGDSINRRVNFEDFLGISIDDISVQELARCRREYCRWWVSATNDAQSDAYFSKVHNQYVVAPSEHAIFAEATPMRAVYLVRNPVHVAPSYAYHRNSSIDEVIHFMSDTTASIAAKRNPDVLYQHLGDWNTHVKSWTEQQAIPLLIIRYEDLCRQPEKTLKKVLDFSGVTIDADRVAQAIKASTLTALQQQEKASGFAEKYPKAKSFFGRQQENNQDKALQLTSSHLETIINNHGPLMELLDYSTDIKAYSF
ncbi:Desulfo-A47934 sulfotransferase [BD1-7 clade bacterium]|uniref:Desulfo-A47934 sulfotransferase n=1 Tax=BD1-7 clade bacterium TaxID=2029982 RepID=A0A5S9QWX4_9GAMM|nr:Desulfo-A47934 sulfotransferase [BD1-7 clade bacterium]